MTKQKGRIQRQRENTKYRLKTEKKMKTQRIDEKKVRTTAKTKTERKPEIQRKNCKESKVERLDEIERTNDCKNKDREKTRNTEKELQGNQRQRELTK